MAMASWRKDYKAEWKKLAARLELNPEAIRRYHANPQLWVCGCPAFLESRFLLCKHLVHCFEPIADRVKFFSQVRRQTTSPFWTHPQLVLKPEFAPRHPPVEAADDGPQSNDDSESDDSEVEAGDDSLAPVEDGPEDDDGNNDGEDIGSILLAAAEICKDQKAKGNKIFLEKVAASQASTRRLVEEITSLRNRRSMPQTWARYKHPATMYYR